MGCFSGFIFIFTLLLRENINWGFVQKYINYLHYILADISQLLLKGKMVFFFQMLTCGNSLLFVTFEEEIEFSLEAMGNVL